MKYPVAIHKDQDSAFGVTVVDIPGCFSAGDTLDEALENTRQAIIAHLDLLAEEGVLAPAASQADDHYESAEYADAVWAYVDIDVTPFSGRHEKINTSLPSLLVKRIDDLVKQGVVKNRSAFLADSAIKEIERRKNHSSG